MLAWFTHNYDLAVMLVRKELHDKLESDLPSFLEVMVSDFRDSLRNGRLDEVLNFSRVRVCFT